MNKTTSNTSKQETVKLSDIKVNPNQPRTIFNEADLQELAASIRKTGLLQPIGLNKVKGNYFLIYGERRLRASHIIQSEIKERDSILAVVFDNLSEAAVKEMQIIENLQRKDIHPIEEAIAFKNLISLKQFDITEIANRVSKSASYVAQRLKLNDLITEFQEAFFKERMTLTTALKICKIAAQDQKELWEEEFAETDEEDSIEVESRTLRNYLNDLTNASFDTKDPSIIKKAGSCGTCPFNSAANTLLFPEEASKAVCMNSPCFREKATISFNREIKKVIEDPAIELVSMVYGDLEDNAAELINKGIKVYQRDAFTEIEKPETPNLAEYEENLQDEYFDSEAEMKEAYKDALKEFDKDLADYEAKVASGKYIKAFVVEGTNTGTYIYISFEKAVNKDNTKLSAKELQERLKGEDVSADDFKAEIKRINDKEIRSKELDEEKTQPLFFELIAKQKEFINNTDPLIKQEKIALVLLMENYTGYDLSKEIAKLAHIKEDDDYKQLNLYKALTNLSDAKLDDLLHMVLRKTLLYKLKPSNGQRPSNSGAQSALKDIATIYNKEGINEIWNEQLKARTKREAKLKERVDILNHKLRLLKQNKQPAKKAA